MGVTKSIGLTIMGAVEPSDDDLDNNTFGIAADFYFNSGFSLGALVAINSGDNESAEGNTMGLRSRLFFCPSCSVEIEYSSFSAENDGYEDIDAFGITAAMRF